MKRWWQNVLPLKQKVNTLFEPFSYDHIPELVDRVKDLWTPQDAPDFFRRLYAELIIRMDMHDNDLQFQICDGRQLKAIACASRKGDVVSAEDWWHEQYSSFNPEQQNSFRLGRDYLTLMDEKTYVLMNDDDVKLDLFISVEQGWGKVILDEAIELYRKQGCKNLFLWTDCECNVDWYFDHGYELVEEGIYELFSQPGDDYKTYIFKKKIV